MDIIIDFEKELEKYGLTPETYEAACKDISDKLEGNNDLDWSEIRDKYDIKCAVDTIRKSSSTIFGGYFRTEYFKHKLYSNPDNYSKETELDKKLESIRKERIKLQTANIERGRVDRSESRQEMYYEYVGSITSVLSLPDFEPLYTDGQNEIEYLLTLADIHYGAKFKCENNEYSPEIAKERFENLSGQVIEFIQKHKILVMLSVAVALHELIGKISKMIGKPVKWVREKEKDHELILQTSKGLEELHKQYEESVRQSIRHDEMIKNDLSALANTVNNIADTLNEMQKKDNATKLKELKDSLIRYYNKYKNIGEWSKLEKDAFWDLFDDYEKRGGDGYIHSIVEPVMRELKEVD